MVQLLVGIVVIALLQLSTLAQSTESSPSFSILIDNALEPDIVSEADTYILLHDFYTYHEAGKACNQIGETIASPSDFGSLSTLIRKSHPSLKEAVWISSPFATFTFTCPGFFTETNSTTSKGCGDKYKAVCTNTAPYQYKYEYPSREKSVTVDLDGTKIRGFRDRLTSRFHGIPFAQPPVGSLRFQAPQLINTPNVKEEEVYDATYPRAMCMQVPVLDANENNTLSEDCLYLNIYTPYLPNQEQSNEDSESENMLLPVIFWIHGGAYQRGSSTYSMYLGMNLASRENAVVVGINYRVGMLGFYSNDTSPQVSTNAGMRDQIGALKWVNKHVAQFGGDPDRITLLGESAGGTSVVTLLQTHETKGLFSQAIVESCNLLSGWQRPEFGQQLSKMFFEKSGCETVECLKDIKNATKLIEYQNHVYEEAQDIFPKGQFDWIEAVRPGIDNDLLLEDWDNAFPSGRFNKVPTLITYNKDEYALYLQKSQAFDNTPVSYDEGYNFFKDFLLGPERTETLVNSPILGFNKNTLANLNDVTEAAISFTTDFCYRCGAEILGHYLTKYVDQVYELTWEINVPQSMPGPVCEGKDGRVCHGSEVVLFFGTASYMNEAIPLQDLYKQNYWSRSRRSMDLYGDFVHQSTLSQFPPRQHYQHNVIHWSDNATVKSGGVNWDKCVAMSDLNLYSRLYYPYCE